MSKTSWSPAVLAWVCLAVLGDTALALRCFHGDGIGCFSNRAPYGNAMGLLPQSPRHIQIGYHLYTRTNPVTPQYLTTDGASISRSNFQGSKKTKFIIHGYTESGTERWPRVMAATIIQEEDVNVVVVDWEKGADSLNYLQSVANTRVVGALIAKLAEALRTSGGATYSSIHLIGFSLGAHVAGYAGERLPGLGRITGLDPAGPAFENKDAAVRLDPSDATYVDVIHTDGSSLGFGLQQAVGHADFFPNGGRQQPGCPINIEIRGASLDDIKCNHMRAPDLFTESITSDCPFRSNPCASNEEFDAGLCQRCGTGCVMMGYRADVGTPTGTFYLSTHHRPPFCMI